MTSLFDAATVSEYESAGWWGRSTVAGYLEHHATTTPHAPAYVTPNGSLDWSGYEHRSTELAGVLLALDLPPSARVAMVLPDGAAVHVCAVATEKAGLTLVGIGARAGQQEISHLLSITGASVLVTHAEHRGNQTARLVTGLRAAGVELRHHITVPDYCAPQASAPLVDGRTAPSLPARQVDSQVTKRQLGPNDLFMLNSTSGTTGLPKCVRHTQNRWFYFHQLATRAGALSYDDVFMGAVPAPFGFGLWTSHFSPVALGVPTVVMERFDPDTALDLIEREQVSVLCCVSTQFIMMLDAQARARRDLSSLRCMFTGGEAVPYERAAAFEEETGAMVLQFYGSNETGALSYTSMADSRERRLRTAGRVIPEMRVRLFDAQDGSDVTGNGDRGQPGCKGPAQCGGYLDDVEGNRSLYTTDGWMLMADLTEIDEEGYLRVVGRLSDLIIRGGKNISAAAVEEEVASHPAVAMAAAVAMPDEVFGERVCVYVTLHSGHALTLGDLVAFLEERGASAEWLPERLEVVDELPRSSGGKVAKDELRDDVRRRMGLDGRPS